MIKTTVAHFSHYTGKIILLSEVYESQLFPRIGTRPSTPGACRHMYRYRGLGLEYSRGCYLFICLIRSTAFKNQEEGRHSFDYLPSYII